MFGLLALAFAKDLRPFRGGKALLGCVIALALALGTELAQEGIPGRGADLADALADLAGFALGLAVARIYAIKRVKIY
jgi:VanZ family protein